MEDKPKHRYRKLGIVAVVVLVLVLANEFIAGSPTLGGLSRRNWDVDIQTGRIRQTHYVCGLCVSLKVEDSILTKALPPTRLSLPSQWKKVYVYYDFCRMSTHTGYHGAISQIKIIERSQSLIRYSDEAKRLVAETLLNLWQSGGDYFTACDYISYVSWKSADMAKHGAKELTVNDLTSFPVTSTPAQSNPGR